MPYFRDIAEAQVTAPKVLRRTSRCRLVETSGKRRGGATRRKGVQHESAITQLTCGGVQFGAA
ncbi:hypothetical protein GCM10009760_52450 [Kitasatospora kazusensis]|uniref:Uncharacterized protein n=1 Tax=Kitasatospora kazusensis TaxID=407974 RepID=A0ABN3A523_9ACTN